MWLKVACIALPAHALVPKKLHARTEQMLMVVDLGRVREPSAPRGGRPVLAKAWRETAKLLGSRIKEFILAVPPMTIVTKSVPGPFVIPSTCSSGAVNAAI
jgi:hypothetical protein